MTVSGPLISERQEAPRGQEDGGMLATRAPSRRIETVPALLVVLLNDTGKLPPIPNLPHAGVLGFRQPTLSDMEAFAYAAVWESAVLDEDGFRKVAGLATYRDVFDLHSSSDVRELCAIRGSRRAVASLVRYLRDDAEIHDRRLVGMIERNDGGLAQLMARFGGRPMTRVPWEYGGAPCLS
jgi:hypothetical protein